MKIKVYVVDFEMPPRLKRWAFRLGIPIFVLATGAVAFAGPIDTTWVVAGQPLTALSLKGDLDGLQAQITSGRFVGTIAGGSYSVGFTTYCGQTTQTTPALGGYRLAKAACQAACGNSDSAHVCSTEEVLRSYELNVSVPQGWVEQGSPIGSGDYQIQDCMGFTVAQAASYGAYWYPGTPSIMGFVVCTTPQAALCCD